MTNKATELKKQVPDFVSGTAIMNSIYNAQGKELDEICAYNEDILNQLFIETATWGLSYWEEFCGLPVLINQDINIRRAKIRAHFASHGTVNKATIKRIARDFGFNDVDIIEDYAPYIVKLIFDNSASGKQVNINDLLDTLRRMCPAHVDFMYIFLFKSWKDIQDNNMTFNMLSNYQWRDYTTDFDTSTNTTPVIGMKVWEDGDLFSMLGFNYNFNRLDNYYQRHTHNGTDSPKILCSNITFNNSELPNSFLNLAINRLNTKITKNDKDRTKLVWGYEGEDKWEKITQFCYNANLGLVSAIRKKGVDIPNGTPLNRLDTYINNIFTGLTPQGTAVANHVREGKTFINANGVTTGTAKYRTGIITPGVNNISINGYVDNLAVKGDANLVSANIKSSVSLWNVRGNLKDAKYPNGSTIDKDFITTSGIRDGAAWVNTNRRNTINCMNVSYLVLAGGTDLRVYDNETGQPYRIFTAQMLSKAANITNEAIKNNMQITHISANNTFVYQDVVNKNLCYIMELDNEGRNLTTLKKFNDYCIAFERTFGLESVVGFKRKIVSFSKSYEVSFPIIDIDEELVPNAISATLNYSVPHTVYYLTKNTRTGATTLHQKNRNGADVFSKSIASLLPSLTNPEATCLSYDKKSKGVLVGVNDKTKLSGGSGTITYSDYAHIIVVDANGNLVKDVDFSNNKIVNPDNPAQKYALKNITAITRQYERVTTTTDEDLFTATFVNNTKNDYSTFNSIELDRSINIVRHISSVFNSYMDKTIGYYIGDSLYALMYNSSSSINNMKNMPVVTRIRRTPLTYTINK